MLYTQEEAIPFKSGEKNHFHDITEPPHVIPTILHKAWQVPIFRKPPALHETSIQLNKTT
jgi:hypothetical protein